MSSSSRSIRVGRLAMRYEGYGARSDGSRRAPARWRRTPRRPARYPSPREPRGGRSTLLLERGYDACEIDFEGSFWMDYPWAERLGEAAREADVALSVHAPLFGVHGPPGAERAQVLLRRRRRSTAAPASRPPAAPRSSSSTPASCSAARREDAIASVVEQLGTLRERLEGKGRAVPFGVEVMGRVRDLGSLDDVVEISRRTGWVRPVLDFAHMHATSDGAYLEAEPVRRGARGGRRRARAGRAVPHPLLRHRVREPQREAPPALRRGHAPRRAAARGARRASSGPATVISESPDEASSQAIRAILTTP